MTELQKEIAIDFTIAFEDLPCGIFKKYELPKREDFLKAAKLYFDNAKDFKVIASVLRHGGYYMSDPQFMSRLITAIRNPAMPKTYIAKIEKLIEELAEEKAKPREPKHLKLPRKTMIYLMRNNRNGFIKIGQSDNPRSREKTLQSEEPEIELLKSWHGIVGQEKELHEKFSHLRLRGEWFKLDVEHMELIEAFFNQGTEVASVR